MTLSKNQKRYMAASLDHYRKKYAKTELSLRLNSIPIPYTRELFNVPVDCICHYGFCDYRQPYPCRVFGRQLVHKIIDELLDLEEGK